MTQRNSGSDRRSDGFTIVEMTVVIIVIAIVTGIALTFAGNRTAEARHLTGAAHLVDAVRTAEAAPLAGPRGDGPWHGAAAAALESIAGIPGAGTQYGARGGRADALPGGGYIGRTLTADEALLLDTNGDPFALTGCAAGSIQLIVHPDNLPAGHALSGVEASWLALRLADQGLPAATDGESVFACAR